MANTEIIVERLETYTEEDAKNLGLLRNALSSDRSSSRLREDRIRKFVDQPDRLLVAARAAETGRIIGGETLVTIPILEANDDEVDGIAWLGFVSTLPKYRGQGIVKRVTLEGLRWCVEQELEDIKFTSNSHNPERDNARAFYLKYGAVIVAKGVGPKDTDFFNWNVKVGLDVLTADNPSSG